MKEKSNKNHIRLTDSQKAEIGKMVESGKYATQSEAIRAGVRLLIETEKLKAST